MGGSLHAIAYLARVEGAIAVFAAVILHGALLRAAITERVERVVRLVIEMSSAYSILILLLCFGEQTIPVIPGKQVRVNL